MRIHSRGRRVVATTMLALATVASSMIAVESPASAAGQSRPATLGNCAYPYVCLYDSAGNKLGQFQDFTSYNQTLSNPNIYQAYNTRNDDVAYFHYANGQYSCIEPHRQAVVVISGWGVPNGIRITTNPTCTFPPPA